MYLMFERKKKQYMCMYYMKTKYAFKTIHVLVSLWLINFSARADTVHPQHHRCRQKGIAACDTDWINNLSVNRVYITAYWLLVAIAAKLWESDPGLSANTYITPNPIIDLWLNSAYRRKNAFI